MSDNLNPDKSPTDLLEKPSSKTGVKKLNKLPLMIVIGAAIIVFLSLGYAMYQRGQMNHLKQDDKGDKSKVDGDPNAIVTSLLQQLRDREEMEKNKPKPKLEDNKTLPIPVQPKKEDNNTKDLGRPTDKQIDAALQKRAEELRKLKEKMLLEAVTAPTKLKNQAALNAGTNANGNPLAQLAALQAMGGGAGAKTPGAEMAKALLATLGKGSNVPESRILKNESWMENAKRSYDYIDSKKTKPVSKYEIKAGSIIPGILITAINSELPGQVLGQVSENVYDTATGKYLLIPQGTKIVGIYNADVTYGQNRIMIAWNRLIFPDGQTLNIGAMNGTDKAGQGGFEDQVDHHYFRIFGSAFLMTLFNGDMTIKDGQLVIRRQNAQTERKETTLEKTAAKMIEKQMDIAPTIKIRSGYKFNIFVTKDMVLEPLPYSVDSNDFNEDPHRSSTSVYSQSYTYQPSSPYYTDHSVNNGSKNIAPALSPVAPVR
jgi:type IV secretion system protein VirB10